MTLRPGHTLSHYRLLEKIGEGGMGIVWKAHDAVLNRPVAIKVLPGDLSRDDERRRLFLEEARHASSVSDARIAQVHELGREGDVDFIVMEYVEGKPLNAILHGRPLPPDKVATIGLQVAHALSRAHRKGLLHRDIKPGNILATPDGDVKVVDFGLATLLRPPETTVGSEASTWTAEQGAARGPGAVGARLVGTLPYMSPEQVRGEKLDARSDIFSFGVVLYEMATGQRPFAAATAAELAQEIQRARPRPPHELVPKLPLELGRIVQKSLGPSRADRYQTMEDLAVDLRRLARELESGSSPSYEDLAQALPTTRSRLRLWLSVGALAAASAAAALWIFGPLRPGRADPRTVLVPALEVRGQVEGAEHVGRGFAEALAVNLAQAQGLNVLPVPASEEMEGSGGLQANRAAVKLGAGRMLTGAITREGAALHATLSLVDTLNNKILWGSQKDAADGSLPALAASLAREAAAALGATPPRKYEYFLYAAGSPMMQASPEFSEAVGALRRIDITRALEATQRLVEAHPNEPEARTLRSFALHAAVVVLETGPASPLSKEFEQSVVALERVDPKGPWGQVFRGLLLTAHLGRHQEAIEIFTRVLTRDDLTPAARAFVLALRGATYRGVPRQGAAALADLEEAVRLDPANNFAFHFLASALFRQGRVEESVIRARQAVALNPTFDWSHYMLGRALARLERWEEALAPFERACELNRVQSNLAMYALALLRTGRENEARAKVAEATSLPQSPDGAEGLARYHASAGNRSEAFRLLRWYAESYPGLNEVDADLLANDPDLAVLRGDPELEAIVLGIRKRAGESGPPSKPSP